MKVEIEKLLDKRAQVVSEARGILETAERENRGMTSEESANYDRAMADSKALKQRVERLQEVEAEERALNTLRDDPAYTGDAGEQRGGKPGAPGADAELHPTDTAEYRGGFEKYIKAANRFDAAESRATLQAGSNTGGGILIPRQTSAEIIKELDNLLWFRGLANVITLNGTESLGIPTLDTDLSDADWTPEISTVSEDTAMALGSRELKPNQDAKLVKISATLVQNRPDFVPFVLGRIRYKFGAAQENAFFNGSGVNRPLGIFTASEQGIPASASYDISTGNDATAITADGLINCKGSLPEQYRKSPGITWGFHRDGLTNITKLKDGDGRYLWLPGLASSQPDMLLNIPVKESEYIPNTFTSGQYVGFLGDLKHYWIADSYQIAIQNLVELFALNNKVGYLGRQWVDGMPVLKQAFRRVKLG